MDSKKCMRVKNSPKMKFRSARSNQSDSSQEIVGDTVDIYQKAEGERLAHMQFISRRSGPDFPFEKQLIAPSPAIWFQIKSNQDVSGELEIENVTQHGLPIIFKILGNNGFFKLSIIPSIGIIEPQSRAKVSIFIKVMIRSENVEAVQWKRLDKLEIFVQALPFRSEYCKHSGNAGVKCSIASSKIDCKKIAELWDILREDNSSYLELETHRIMCKYIGEENVVVRHDGEISIQELKLLQMRLLAHKSNRRSPTLFLYALVVLVLGILLASLVQIQMKSNPFFEPMLTNNTTNISSQVLPSSTP